jgi:hypothetical protein
MVSSLVAAITGRRFIEKIQKISTLTRHLTHPLG